MLTLKDKKVENQETLFEVLDELNEVFGDKYTFRMKLTYKDLSKHNGYLTQKEEKELLQLI